MIKVVTLLIIIVIFTGHVHAQKVFQKIEPGNAAGGALLQFNRNSWFIAGLQKQTRD